MPPTSNMRKTSAATTTVTHVNDLSAPPRRTTSGRAVRQNTTRPTNYYARPFGSFSAAPAANNAEHDMQDTAPPGFFPALTYFTDAITALPKEVMRQFTLMKEVEAKIHGPNERLGELVDALMEYPVPPRKSQQDVKGATGQGLLSLTANNSVMGSTAPSLINGVAPNPIQLSAQNSVTGSVNGEEVVQPENEEDSAKRQMFHELRRLTPQLLVNLDEKNVVLAEAKRILDQQQSRLDSVMPYVDSEISEEARLGSMTHWAYSDNRQKKHTTGTAMNRRDMAATNSLVAAASAIHESDIAQARRDATRETAREKHKGGRGKEHIDSDFDDKPKKTHPKIAKSKAAGQAGSLGLAMTANGEPVKKRRVDKGLAAPAMDRTMSAATKVAKSAKEIPRSTPTGEPVKKVKPKPPPLPSKRKLGASSHASPAVASSPMQSSFNAVGPELPGNVQPQSARLRQNSTATKLRHEKVANDEGSRPTSAPGKVNGEKANGKRKAADEQEEQDTAKKTTERSDGLKREDIDMGDTERPYPSRSGSNSGRAGQGSATGTPRQETFSEGGPAMLRSRSMRSMRGNREDDSSSEPQAQGVGKHHKRNMSNSHLVRQLAPFNRSPNLDRSRLDDMDEDLESLDARMQRREEEEEHQVEQRSPPKRSRRNTAVQIAASSPPPSEHPEEDIVMPDVEEPEEQAEPEPEVPDVESIADIEEEAEDSEPGDPDDPNEPKYCYCNRGSYGEMIACDNEQCPREWFHLGCTGLKEPPEEEEKWYCKECAPLFRKGKGRGRK